MGIDLTIELIHDMRPRRKREREDITLRDKLAYYGEPSGGRPWTEIAYHDDYSAIYHPTSEKIEQGRGHQEFMKRVFESLRARDVASAALLFKEFPERSPYGWSRSYEGTQHYDHETGYHEYSTTYWTTGQMTTEMMIQMFCKLRGIEYKGVFHQASGTYSKKEQFW